MERVATPRLIEASATLDPAGRALLNLWLHRGLPDAELARLAGLDPQTVTDRKLDIVEHLSDRLGLPPYEIVAALRMITVDVPAPEPTARPTAATPPAPTARPTATAATTAASTGPIGTTAPPARAAPARPAGPSATERARHPARRQEAWRMPPPPAVHLRRGRSALGPLTGTTRLEMRERWRPLGYLLAALAVLAILLAMFVPTGDGTNAREVSLRIPHHKRQAPASASHQPPAPASHQPTPAAAPVLLSPPAGAPPGPRGRLTVLADRGRPAVRVTVSGLPAPARGRYEVWLYTTVIDSVAIGRLPPSGAPVTLHLPAGARPSAYRWIDVSLQPANAALNSGESVLRAVNPLRTRTQAAHRASSRPLSAAGEDSGSRPVALSATGGR